MDGLPLIVMQMVTLSKSKRRKSVMIYLDSFYTIGKTHQVCQDYVIHGEEPVPYVILGDGCSSSPDTDVGARLVVHAAKKAIAFSYYSTLMTSLDKFFQEFIKNSLHRVSFELGLNNSNLDSSLIFIYQNTKDPYLIKLVMMGDGVIITKMKEDDSSVITKVSYKGEAPYYLSYSMNTFRKEAYTSTINKMFSDSNAKMIESIGGGTKLSLAYYDLTAIDYELEDIDYIIIASDGLDSFYNQETGEKIPLESIVNELTNFKSFKGEFLKRRVKRMLKDYEKRGIFHYDDLSFGIIYNMGN
jgi:hypothetical protein